MNPAHGLRSLVRQWVVPVESPPNSSFVRKCAYAAFERAVEPLHSRDLVIPAIESMPRTPIRGRNPVPRYGAGIQREAWAPPIFIPWCGGTSRRERFVRRCFADIS